MSYRDTNAEDIRLEYIQRTVGYQMHSPTTPRNGHENGPQDHGIDSEVFKMALHESFFNGLSEEQLEALLEAVLGEMRSRNSDLLKGDLLTSSKLLSMGRL